MKHSELKPILDIEEEFLSIKEFALKVKFHPNTIRRSIKMGKISAFRIGTGKRAFYRIPKSEINRIAMFDLEVLINEIIEKRQKVSVEKLGSVVL